MNKITLTGTPPSTSSIYKYRNAGKFIMGYMSAEGKQKKEEIRYELMQQYKNKCSQDDFNIEIKYFFPDKRRRDIDNFLKLIFDAATGLIWEDDSQIQSMMLSKYIDKDNPRVELTIL